MSETPTRRRSDAKKNAVIALAILVLLLFLWKLRTSAEKWGPAGAWLRTNVFGALGGGSGGGHGPGTENGTDVAGTLVPGPNGHGSSTISSNLVQGAVSKPADSTVSNELVKVISDFPDEPTQTNRSPTSPDATAMARRLGEAGAKGGDIQLSLFWRNHNDLDLHCIDPMGFEIFYSNKTSPLSGGELDIDLNAQAPYNSAPVENIYWPRAGAPAGLYRVFVVYYAPHDMVDTTPYTVRTVVQNKTNYFAHAISFTGQRKTHWICTIKYDPANPNPASRCRFMPFQ